MPPLRQVGGFFLRLVLIYGLLAVPWPWIVNAYAAVYRGVGNVWFASFGSDGIVRFVPPSDPGASHDTEIVIRNRRSGVYGTTTHSSRTIGYLPTIEALALILATPLPWSRRRRALLWGLLISHVLIWLRLEILLMHWFTGTEAWCIYRPGPFWDRLLEKAFVLAVIAPTTSFVLPLFVWLAATFRRGDLDRLLESGPQTAA